MTTEFIGVLPQKHEGPADGRAGRLGSVRVFDRAGCHLSPKCLIRDVEIGMILVKVAPEPGDQLLIIRAGDRMPALTGDMSRHGILLLVPLETELHSALKISASEEIVNPPGQDAPDAALVGKRAGARTGR